MAELTETNWKAVVDDLRSDILDTDEMAVDPNVHLKNIDSLIEFHTKVLDPNTRALDERVKELRERLKAEQQDAYERQKDLVTGEHRIGERVEKEYEWCEGRIQGFNSALDALNELFPAELKEKEKQDAE